MKLEDAEIGKRVRSLKDFDSVPKGTEGVIDEDYGTGIMVAWDLDHYPIPKGYREFDKNTPIGEKPYLLRDGFDKKWELEFLEVI